MDKVHKPITTQKCTHRQNLLEFAFEEVEEQLSENVLLTV
jgi:hypothetical protein